MEHVTARRATVPALGLGTARFDDDERCRTAVRTALDAGYRHVDTAQMYDTERAVGAAVAAAGVDRDDVFITTKLDAGNRSREAVLESTRESLAALDTEYVDLLLVHTPNRSVLLDETVGAMNDLQSAGLVDHIGVSNFSVGQVRRAMDRSRTPVVTNQVEYHPYRDRSRMLSFCRDHGIALTAASPLAVGEVTDDPVLESVGDRHGKSATQVALRWLVQQEGVVAIPKAGDPEHVRENAAVFDFELTDAEMREVADQSGGLLDRIRNSIVP